MAIQKGDKGIKAIEKEERVLAHLFGMHEIGIQRTKSGRFYSYTL
jgi:hypothetical protein